LITRERPLCRVNGYVILQSLFDEEASGTSVAFERSWSLFFGDMIPVVVHSQIASSTTLFIANHTLEPFEIKMDVVRMDSEFPIICESRTALLTVEFRFPNFMNQNRVGLEGLFGRKTFSTDEAFDCFQISFPLVLIGLVYAEILFGSARVATELTYERFGGARMSVDVVLK